MAQSKSLQLAQKILKNFLLYVLKTSFYAQKTMFSKVSIWFFLQIFIKMTNIVQKYISCYLFDYAVNIKIYDKNG